MSSINLTSLKQTPASTQNPAVQLAQPAVNFTYSDLQLDLAVGTILGNYPANTQKNLSDIKISYDAAAIKNSIENIFNSMPGQWVLNPDLGIGLPRFLFEPIDKNTANQIAQAIVQNLTTFESRATIVKLQVVGDPDNHVYEITLAIQLANVNNSNVVLKGTLDSNKFRFLS